MATPKEDNDNDTKLPAKPETTSEGGGSSLARMPSITKWFRSTSIDLFKSTDAADSVADILRDEALKSDVSFDPKMLASMAANNNIQFPPPLNSVATTATARSTSACSQDSFLQKILGSYDGGLSLSSRGSSGGSAAPSSKVTPAAAAAASLPSKPAAPAATASSSSIQALARNTSTSSQDSIMQKMYGSARTAISKLCTSGDWAPDLTAHEPVNVEEVFQTKNSNDLSLLLPPPPQSSSSSSNTAAAALPHEELSVARKMAHMAASQPTKRPKEKKTDWNADFMQQMASAMAAPTAAQSQPTTSTVPKAPLKKPPSAAFAGAAFAASSSAATLGQGSSGNSAKTTTATLPKPASRKRKQPDTTPALPTYVLPSGGGSGGGSASRRRAVTGDAAPNKTYVVPTEADVLMGRGGRTNNHPGNKWYLQAKDAMQARYMAASKQDKTPISQELADKVHAWGGRFLKLDGGDKWFEVDEITARKKCSQTLREINTPEVRKAKRTKYMKA